MHFSASYSINKSQSNEATTELELNEAWGKNKWVKNHLITVHTRIHTAHSRFGNGVWIQNNLTIISIHN